MTTRQFSYALKSKLPGGLCLIIIGTEGNAAKSRPAKIRRRVPAVCHARNNPAPAARATRMEVSDHREEVSGQRVPAVSGERTGSFMVVVPTQRRQGGR
jgi:hypothetical protein